MVAGPTPEKATKGVPERWLHCPKAGNLIMNLFFPFKTPLCHIYNKQISDKKLRFHEKDVFTHPNLGGRRIGLWIDLTKTDRYYFKENVTEKRCLYKKIPLIGHNASPSAEETEVFIKIVAEFTEAHPTEVIGVHCTHGFNRTGFLIASYLCEIEGWEIDAAISEFARNRDRGIYKQEYLNDLFSRYGQEDDDRIEAPPRPSWDGPGEEMMSGHDFEDHNAASTSSSSQSSSHQNNNEFQNQHQKQQQNAQVRGKQFMDGLVRGVTLCADEGKKNMLRGKIKTLCNYERDGFPGLQPVSLSRENIHYLSSEAYMVSWKADGMRYMVYIIDEGEVYAFDRDNEVFEIDILEFPGRKGGHVKNTLVDAEMIVDKVTVDGREQDLARLLIYDVIHFEEFKIRKQDFSIRRDCIKKELIEPRNEAFKRNKICKERQTMSVRIKEFWEMVAVPKLFEPKFVQNVGHEIDGLIFQPVKRPYEAGRCDIVLKWKPPSHNSVDFLLKVEKITKEGMLPEWKGNLYVLHWNQPFGQMNATNSLKKYDNKIIECTLELDAAGNPKEWKLMRERTDKSAPNAYNTAKNVLGTMLHPVSKEFLCEYVAKNCSYTSQEPPSKRPRM